MKIELYSDNIERTITLQRKPDLEAFYILVKLNFTESNDAMDNIWGRMGRIASNLAFVYE